MGYGTGRSEAMGRGKKEAMKGKNGILLLLLAALVLGPILWQITPRAMVTPEEVEQTAELQLGEGDPWLARADPHRPGGDPGDAGALCPEALPPGDARRRESRGRLAGALPGGRQLDHQLAAGCDRPLQAGEGQLPSRGGHGRPGGLLPGPLCPPGSREVGTLKQ